MLTAAGKLPSSRHQLYQSPKGNAGGPLASKSVRTALRPCDSARTCDTEKREFKTTSKTPKSCHKKLAVRDRQLASGKQTETETPLSPYGRKISMAAAIKSSAANKGRRQCQISPNLKRKSSEQNFKCATSFKPAQHQKEAKLTECNSVSEWREQIIPNSHSEEMIASSPFRSMQTTRQLPNQQPPHSGRTAKQNSHREDDEISRLRSENEFMRKLYYRLCTAKENDRIKHAEAEEKLRREQHLLEVEVKRLRAVLSSSDQEKESKQQKQIRIDHLFTHRLYDKQKNKVSQCIREAASYLEQSEVHPLTNQNSQAEYFSSRQLGVRAVLQEPCQQPVSSLSKKKLQLPIWSTHQEPDESKHPSTETGSDSFCSLAIESAGESFAKE